jgi:hypothetical protein
MYRAIKLICNRVIHGLKSVCLSRLICRHLGVFIGASSLSKTTYDFGFMDNSITNQFDRSLLDHVRPNFVTIRPLDQKNSILLIIIL